MCLVKSPVLSKGFTTVLTRHVTSQYGSIDDTIAEIEVEIGSPSPADVRPGHTNQLHPLSGEHYLVPVGGDWSLLSSPARAACVREGPIFIPLAFITLYQLKLIAEAVSNS